MKLDMTLQLQLQCSTNLNKVNPDEGLAVNKIDFVQFFCKRNLSACSHVLVKAKCAYHSEIDCSFTYGHILSRSALLETKVNPESVRTDRGFAHCTSSSEPHV